MGSTVSPNALAMIDVVAEARVPMIAFAASEKIVSPVDDKRRWVFKTAQNDRMMAEAIVEHMAANGVKTVGFIGFSDAYGEGWFENFKAALDAAGLSLVVNERYNRTDTSVTGQVLKIVGAKPDAVLIAGSGTPAALPQKDAQGARLTPEKSTRPMGWPTTISCACAGAIVKELFFLPGRCWWRHSCQTIIRPSRRRWNTFAPMKKNSAKARCLPSERTCGMRANCSRRRCPRRSPRPSPVRPNSASRCVTLWST